MTTSKPYAYQLPIEWAMYEHEVRELDMDIRDWIREGMLHPEDHERLLAETMTDIGFLPDDADEIAARIVDGVL